jgi:hypothetical protein
VLPGFGVVVTFGVLAFVLIYQRKSAEAPLALATTALGGIVGLLPRTESRLGERSVAPVTLHSGFRVQPFGPEGGAACGMLAG